LNLFLDAVGRLKEPYFQAAEAEYRKRLRPYCSLEIREHKSDAALAKAIPERAHLYVFDERGELVSSEDFAREILGAEAERGGGAPVVFAIGGPDGHDPAMRERASRVLAFGRLTIAHRLVRLIVLEQIYRGFKILRGEPYHRA
jgi:23S rRNA (pseudouridine1915-N3)-methyltransferase